MRHGLEPARNLASEFALVNSLAKVALLLNESHLVDFFHAGDARANFGQAAFTQT